MSKTNMNKTNMLLEGVSINSVLERARIPLCLYKSDILLKPVNESIISTLDLGYVSDEEIMRDEEHGYIIHKVATKLSPDHPYEIATNLEGEFIGTPAEAELFCVKLGLYPQSSPNNDSDVCCIGYSKDEDGWSGWSHRARSPIFKVGYKIESSHEIICGKKPEWEVGFICPSVEVAKEMAIAYAEAVS